MEEQKPAAMSVAMTDILSEQNDHGQETQGASSLRVLLDRLMDLQGSVSTDELSSLDDTQLLRLQGMRQAYLYLSRALPIPSSLWSYLDPSDPDWTLGVEIGTNEVWACGTTPHQSALPPASLSLLTSGTDRRSIAEALLQRERLVVSRLNCRLRTVVHLLDKGNNVPLPLHIRSQLESEKHALSLLALQRQMREAVLGHCRESVDFVAFRPAHRRRRRAFAEERRLLDREVKRAEEEEKQFRVRAREEFLREMVEKAKKFGEGVSKKKPLASRIARDIMNWHARRRQDAERQREAEEKRRIRMLKEGNEEEFRAFVEKQKDERLMRLIERIEMLFKTIIDRMRMQGGDSPLPVTSHGEEGKSMLPTYSREFYTLMHKREEKIDIQPACLVGGNLKHYQIQSLQWMVSLYNNSLNGILADEMGLGKTIQTISLLGYLRESKTNVGPHLIIVPLSTIENWVQEFALWLPECVVIRYAGHKDHRKQIQTNILRPGKFNVLLTTYEYVTRPKDANALRKTEWEYIVVDEGHRLKNHDCKLVKSLAAFRSKHRLLLTGTPLQNNIHELWALLNFLMPGSFSASSFDEWFSKPIAAFTGEQLELSETETVYLVHKLHTMLRPFLLRREKKDVESRLPPKHEVELWCDNSAMQTIIEAQMQNGEYVDAEKRRRGLANSMVQFRKVCNHPFLLYKNWYDLYSGPFGPEALARASGKFQMLDMLVPKLKAAGHKVLIFAQWVMTLDLIEELLHHRGYTGQWLRLDGGTSGETRAQYIRDFSQRDSPHFLFLMTTKAGGLGLNLQVSDTVILFDMDWNPQNDLQAIARSHRIGQQREVRVFYLISNTAFELALFNTVRKKLDANKGVIGLGDYSQASQRQKSETEAHQDILAAMQGRREAKPAKDIARGSELNRLFARTEAEFHMFEEMDESGVVVMQSLVQEDELPGWLKLEPKQERTAEEQRQDLMNIGPRQRSTVHYNFDLLTEDDLLDAELEGIDLETKLVQKMEELAKRKKRGRKVKDREPQLSRSSSLADASSAAAAAAPDLYSSLMLIVEELLSHRDMSKKPPRVVGESFKESLLEIKSRVEVQQYNDAAEFKQDVMSILRPFEGFMTRDDDEGAGGGLPGMRGGDSQVAIDAVFLENLMDRLIEEQFPYIDDDEQENDEEEDDDEGDDEEDGHQHRATDADDVDGDDGALPRRGASGERSAQRGDGSGHSRGRHGVVATRPIAVDSDDERLTPQLGRSGRRGRPSLGSRMNHPSSGDLSQMSSGGKNQTPQSRVSAQLGAGLGRHFRIRRHAVLVDDDDNNNNSIEDEDGDANNDADHDDDGDDDDDDFNDDRNKDDDFDGGFGRASSSGRGMVSGNTRDGRGSRSRASSAGRGSTILRKAGAHLPDRLDGGVDKDGGDPEAGQLAVPVEVAVPVTPVPRKRGRPPKRGGPAWKRGKR